MSISSVGYSDLSASLVAPKRPANPVASDPVASDPVATDAVAAAQTSASAATGGSAAIFQQLSSDLQAFLLQWQGLHDAGTTSAGTTSAGTPSAGSSQTTPGSSAGSGSKAAASGSIATGGVTQWETSTVSSLNKLTGGAGAGGSTGPADFFNAARAYSGANAQSSQPNELGFA